MSLPRPELFPGCPYHSFQRDISEMNWENFFKFGTHVHYSSRMNWLEFDGDLTTQIFGITQEFAQYFRQNQDEMIQPIIQRHGTRNSNLTGAGRHKTTSES